MKTEIEHRDVIAFLYGLKRELCDGCTPEEGKLIQDTMQHALDCVIKYQMMQADYENRLKADMVAILEEISLEIDEMDCTIDHDFEGYYTGHVDCQKLIREKINSLKENSDVC